MAKLQAQWPIETDRLMAKADSFAVVLEQVGASRFEIGIDRIIQERHDTRFPMPADLRDWIPARQSFTHCGECQHGFLDAGFDEYGNHQVRLCSCRKRNRP